MKATVQIAWQNIRKRRFKYGAILTLLVVSSIAIFVGGILLKSMETGLCKAKERIGAEIIVVPDGYASAVEDSLFKGKSCTLYFERKWEREMKKLPEVEKVSSQLYLATLGEMACCDGKTQLIAMDGASDFLIQPWLKEQGITGLREDEIVVGAALYKKKGEIVKYYNKKFRVKAVLEHTGMGYDESCFVSYKAAHQMIADTRNKIFYQLRNQKNPISMVLLKLKPNVDAMTLKYKMEKKYKNQGISVYSMSSKLNTFADKIQEFKVFGKIMNVCMVLLAMISVFTILMITTYIRKNEIGSMLSIGLGKSNIVQIFLLEYAIVALAAFIFTVVVSSLILFPFEPMIAQTINLPYVEIGVKNFLILCGEILAIDVGIALFSGIISFDWIWRKEPAEMIKEITG